VDQGLQYDWLEQGDTRSIQIGRGVEQGCCFTLILFNLYSEYLTNEALAGFEYLNIDDKYFALWFMQTVLQDKSDILVEVGRCGVEVNVEKN